MRNVMLVVAAVAAAVVGVIGFFVSRSITRPITRLTATMQALASGKLDIEVAGPTVRR